MTSIDTSPKRLRELADAMRFACAEDFGRWETQEALLALAAEKESPGPVCPTCGSDCNERDELEKAEREIERLKGLLAKKEAQHHIADTCEISKPAEVPLPDPALAAVVTELFGTSPYYTADQMRQYGQACDKAARYAAFEECIKAITGQIDLTDLDLGEQSERGMSRALEIVQAAKKEAI